MLLIVPESAQTLHEMFLQTVIRHDNLSSLNYRTSSQFSGHHFGSSPRLTVGRRLTGI
jgi:hypothetical protein